MDIQWELRKKVDPQRVKSFSEELKVPEIIAAILLSKGISSYNEAYTFLKPSVDSLHDPFLMKGMDRAVARILDAVKDKEKILIYGDYDVDGVTSTSILYLVLTKFGGNVSYYIPERIKEGYGLSIERIKKAAGNGINLIVSVDCGITNHKEIKFAKEHNIDVIICDHHEPSDTVPDSYAILNPKQRDDTYPFKHLAGVGVTFKLVQGLMKEAGFKQEEAFEYIDIVAVGTTADIVPLLGENRIIVKQGLEKINTNPTLGLKTLLDAAGMLANEITTWHIIYGIAPRINAGGRISNAEKGVQLLITNDINEALKTAYLLENENNKRKTLDEHIQKEALGIVEKTFDPARDYSIILAHRDWHLGVVGICASRLSGKFYRPTVMLSITDGIAKGSGRSIPEFDLYSALKTCSDDLVEFGGHKLAAGLTIKEENIEKFSRRFEEIAREKLSGVELKPKLKIDGYCNLDEINSDLIRLLKYLEPHGFENEKPIFMDKNLKVVGTPRILKRKHLKFKIKKDFTEFEAIGFGKADLVDRLDADVSNLNMAFYIDENVWDGRKYIQLNVKDLK